MDGTPGQINVTPACATPGASDTNMDDGTPAAQWFAKTRRVWGAIDTTQAEHPTLTEEPRCNEI